MKSMETLLKALMLAAAEYKTKGNVNSIPLLEELVTEIKKQDRVKIFGDDSDLVETIISTLEKIISKEIKPEDGNLVNVEVLLTSKPSYLKLFDKYVNSEVSEVMLRNLKKDLYDRLKTIYLKRELLNALGVLNTNPKNVNNVINKLMTKLESIKEKEVMQIAGLVGEIDLDSEDSVVDAANEAVDLAVGKDAFPTAWPCVNELTQGGFRRGEFVTVSALQHNYKSSFVKSIFTQILRHSKPILKDPSKKPLVIFISLEEELDNIFLFNYMYLKYSEENVVISKKDIEHLDKKEVALYVKEQLTKNGFSARILRFNPLYLTYDKLFSLVEKYEAEGYEVQAVILDYVKKMNRAGINRNGPAGTDLLELFSTIRNYMSAKAITFITPHQLSTDAKQLERNGMRGDELVKFVAGRGYYADSKQLDQEIDLELFIAKTRINKEWKLSIQRGKHRIPTNIPDELKFTMLNFPKNGMPIPEQNEVHPDVCYNPDNTTENDFDF